MDVIKLDKVGGSYLKDAVVEGYTNMVWTERYLDPGDFQMVTSKIAEMRALIPEGELISLMDTTEVMIVENHSIKTNDDGVEELTITGRSVPSFLESRAYGGEITGAAGTDRYQATREACERALLFIYDCVVEAPSYPISVGIFRPTYDELPNVSTSLSRVYSASSNAAIVNFGDCLTIVKGLLGPENKGLRTIRPKSTGGYNTTFDQAWGPPHGATYTLISSPDTTLRFDVYDGTDRTASVVFDYKAGMLDTPSYLWTLKDYKNILSVWDSVGEQPEVYRPGIGTPTGWDRRVAFLDGSSWQQNGTDSGGVYNDIAARALAELIKLPGRVYLDAEISKTAPYVYKTDYFLGDLVTLRADHGLSQSMRVTEFVRTEDESGDRGYPTVVSV